MKLTWYGHAAFGVETEKAKILIDPFFTGNPVFPEDQRDDAIAGLTHIALTHGHGDHIGDTLAIAAKTGATVIGNYDLIQWLQAQGLEKADCSQKRGATQLTTLDRETVLQDKSGILKRFSKHFNQLSIYHGITYNSMVLIDIIYNFMRL